MKGVVSALLVALGAVAAYDCPSDWTQDKLLVHEDCHKFYKCTYGVPVEMVCDQDLYFNINNGQCDWQSNVDCGERNIPGQDTTTAAACTSEPTTPEPTTPEPTTPEPTTPEPTTPEPTTPEPTTPEPTTPEPTTPEPTTPEPTTPEPTTPEPTTPEPTTPEPTTPEPTTPEPTTPEPTTPEPITPEPTTPEPTTPEPTTPEPTTPEPTTPEPTTPDPCPTTPSPTTPESCITEETTPEPSTPTPGFLPNGCPENPHVHWLLPVEEDCNAFYYCVWGELQLRNCPDSLHFNKKIQVCDWPANAGCATSANKHSMAQYL